ncbi:MAG: ABC transporter transmembrane domain-containing protein [Pseudomonadota bacterium]
MSERSVYIRLLKLVSPYWGRMAGAMVCTVIVASLTSATAYILKPTVDNVFVKKDAVMICLIPLAIIFLFLGKGISYYGHFYLLNSVGQKIVADVRESLYKHLNLMSLSFFNRTPTGIIMSRVINDVGMLQAAVSNAVVGIVKNILTILGLTLVIFYQDWRLACIAVLIFPAAIIPIVKFGKRLRRINTENQEIWGKISVLLHETITGSRVVKAFNMEAHEMKRFSGRIRDLYRVTMNDIRIRAMSRPLMDMLGGVGIAFIVYYGGLRVIEGTSTPGTFFSFLAAVVMLYEPIKDLNDTNSALQQGVAAAIRVFGFLDTPPEISDRESAIDLMSIRCSIEFRSVYFQYGDTLVLKDIKLWVKAGEVLAIVGTSGGGKTTLVNLIPRFYEVTKGAVLIDGLDIRDVTLVSLRSQIAVVTQQTILFNDTVRNNIAYGDINRGMDEIVDAAKAAYAFDFIERLPQKWDTVIGEQGVKLSGGERQRISIARAILKNAPILILDEATSSLDTESEFEVQKALDNLMKGRTTFVIAHRLSTVRNADRIIVIKEGRMAEEGTHDTLIAADGEYKKLHDMQFHEEEEQALPEQLTADSDVSAR